MHKVIAERPRREFGYARNGARANLPDELLPKSEGIKRPHLGRKMQTALLGPLHRWLRSQVGRPWNDVYSEACSVIKPNSVARMRLKTQLLEFVQRHTFMRDGKVWCYFSDCCTAWEMPVTKLTGRRSWFYVHPEKGSLCEAPLNRRRPLFRDKEAKERALTWHWLNETTLLRQFNGCWFECRMETIPEYCDRLPFDYAERKTLNWYRDAKSIYGRYVYCAAKRQLSRQELRKLGLSNHSQIERSLQLVILVAC